MQRGDDATSRLPYAHLICAFFSFFWVILRRQIFVVPAFQKKLRSIFTRLINTLRASVRSHTHVEVPRIAARRQDTANTQTYEKTLKIKIYRNIILPVVSYGCETWSLTLWEEKRLRVFENMVLRIFGPRRDEVTGEWRIA